MATGSVPPPTHLVGRRPELERIARAFDDARLVTLLGPPGAGKTRLATEHASARQAGDFEGEVWFCDASLATTEDDLRRAAASSLGLSLARDATLEVALAARGPTLLVLDNLEQMAHLAGPVVMSWLGAAAELELLVTSRVRLGAAGEVAIDVGPLGLPTDEEPLAGEAVDLLIHRARAARAGFTVEPAEAKFVAAIARRLDGLPLALELAGARLGVLGPKQLLARLGSGLDEPNRGDARRPTLRAALDASFELLAPNERALLTCLSVFRGGFSLEAVEAMSANGGAIDALATLSSSSLVRVEEARGLPGEVRYSLLETVRAYAEDRLSAEERELAQTKHAEVALAVAEAAAARAEGSEAELALAHLSAEIENLLEVHRRALARRGPEDSALAIRVALALEPLFYMRGPVALGLELVDGALALADATTVSFELCALAHKARGRALRDLGRLDESARELETWRDKALAANERGLAARLTGHLALLREAEGRASEASALFEEALGAAREVGDARSHAMLLGMWARGKLQAGDEPAAMRAFDEAIRLLGSQGNRYSEAFTRALRAEAHVGRGRVTAARTDLEHAIAVYRSFGERRHEGKALQDLAALDQDLGAWDDARAGFERAIECYRAYGSRTLEGGVMAELAGLEREAGRPDVARSLLVEAAAIAREANDHRAEGLVIARLASLDAELGKAVAARALLAEATSLLSPANAGDLAELEIHRAIVRACDGDASAIGDLAKLSTKPTRGSAVARRLAERATRADSPPPSSALGARLVVAASGRSFKLGSSSVSLQRRAALRLILERLVRARLEAPGEALSRDALLEAGWPGVKVIGTSGALRVYTALSTLRRLGLRDLLMSRDDGYLLDPAVVVERVHG